jgi:hypothetical protein
VTEPGTARRQPTSLYQVAARTTLPAAEVLGRLDLDRLPGVVVAERGDHYLLFKAPKRVRYGAGLAAALGIAICLALLICTAITPVVLAGLPAALLPALPLLFDHRVDLALSAVDDEGFTRVTAHGQATEDLADYLDRYLGGLPPVTGNAA